MARFVLDSIDYDQNESGVPAAISELQSQLPVTAKLARRMAGSDRNDYAFSILEWPIKYQPSAQFD